MISHAQVVRISSTLSLPEETIEKDYFIELLLFYIAQNKGLKDLIFRGGTALRKNYFPDYRFSEDLDFAIDAKVKKFLNYFKQTTKKVNQNYPAGTEVKTYSLEQGRLQIFIGYNIVPQISGVKELKIDILQDEHIYPHKKTSVIFTYQEFKNFKASILVYDLESIVAGKIARIFDVVNEPRDIYDLWKLLKLDLDFNKIKNIFKKQHGFKFNPHDLVLEIQKQEYRINWQIRLSRQMSDIPEFEKVIKELKILIKNKLKTV